MKPSFALSLSSTGITLLHRASGGWRNVGTVFFDSADLDADLDALREKGLEFESPMQCKLILPNDQIRYLTLETGDISDETRRAEMRLALADATPYELHELAFDVSADGTRTHAAAVALETLEEAEHFAQAHGFGPTSFVAQPESEDYLGEPFFGAAQAMNSTEVTPDGIAVIDIGPAILPAPEPEPEPGPEPEPEAKAEPESAPPSDDAEADAERGEATAADAAAERDADSADDTTPTDETAAVTDAEHLAALDAETTSDLEDELAPQSAMSDVEAEALNQTAADEDPAETPEITETPKAPETSTPAPDAAKAAPRRPTVEDVAAQLSARAAQALSRDDLPDKVSPHAPTGLPDALDFGAVANLMADQGKSAAKASADTTPSLNPATAPKATQSAPEPTPTPDAPATPAPSVGFTSRRTAPTGGGARDVGAANRTPGAERPASRIPTLSAVRPSTPAPIAPPAAQPAPAPAKSPVAASLAGDAIPATPAASVPPLVAASAVESTSDTSASPAAPGKQAFARIKPKKIAVPADSQAARDAAAARAAYDADTSDAKPRARSVARAIGGKPRFLGLMLTSLLLLFMAVVAAIAYWSDARFDDSDAAFAPEPAPVTLPETLPETATQDLPLDAPSDEADAPAVTEDTPAPDAPVSDATSTPAAPVAAPDPLLSDAQPADTLPSDGVQSTDAQTGALTPLTVSEAPVSETPVDQPIPDAQSDLDGSTGLTSTDTAVLDALQDENLATRPELPDAEAVAAPETDALAEAAAPAPLPLGSDGTTLQDADRLSDPEAAGDELAFLDPLATPDATDLNHRTTYAATGIWQQIPEALAEDATSTRADLDDIYVASIDKRELSHDSVALPSENRFGTDLIQNALSSPVPADSEFDLDARGLVVATPEGALNPDGIMVFLGEPTKVPPTRPAETTQAAPEPTVQIARIRPRPRPADLQDRAERASLGGLNLEELAKQRPRARPAGLTAPSVTETAGAASEAVDDAVVLAALPPATAQAIGNSVVPRARPANFQTLAARARETPQATPQAPARAVASASTVAPRIPSSASVSREATIANAIDLRKMNLIGISGSASNRQALIRLPSGRVRTVKVGDNIDGGRVTAIDSERLLYQKRGRNHTLRLPNG